MRSRILECGGLPLLWKLPKRIVGEVGERMASQSLDSTDSKVEGRSALATRKWWQTTALQRLVLLAVVGLLPANAAELSAGGYHFVRVDGGGVQGLGDPTYGQLGSNPPESPPPSRALPASLT